MQLTICNKDMESEYAITICNKSTLLFLPNSSADRGSHRSNSIYACWSQYACPQVLASRGSIAAPCKPLLGEGVWGAVYTLLGK